jgi:hypothetical protein
MAWSNVEKCPHAHGASTRCGIGKVASTSGRLRSRAQLATRPTIILAASPTI